MNLDPEDPGEWRVDDLAQDPSVVTLDGVEETETTLTARYAPAGDGEVRPDAVDTPALPSNVISSDHLRPGP